MGTHLEYNGILLPDVKTTRLDQEIRATEDGADVMHYRFVISVETLVHSTTAQSGIGRGTERTVEEMQMLYGRLMKKRAPFRFRIGTKVLLEADATSDRDNGPNPQNLNIIHIARDVFRIVYTIEINVLYCAGSPEPLSSVANTAKPSALIAANRWTYAEALDQHFNSTRTLSGTLRVVNINTAPHNMRRFVVPPLPDGFKRVSQEYTDSADGLTLSYTIVDQEEHAAPPPPAISWRGTQTESAQNNGNLYRVNISLSLTGNAGLKDRTGLFQACMSVIGARLQWDYTPADKPGKVSKALHVENLSITDYFHEARIDVHLTAMRIPEKGGKNSYFSVESLRLGKKLDDNPVKAITNYNHRQWYVGSPYSERALSGIFYHFLNDPCNGGRGIPNALPVQPVGQQHPARSNVQQPVFAQSGEPIEEQNNEASQESQNAPYTHIDLDNRYETDSGQITMPIARTNGAGETKINQKKITLFKPSARRTITGRIERIGDLPQLPESGDHQVKGATERHVSRRILLEAAEPQPDGRLRHIIEFEDVYLDERAVEDDEGGNSFKEFLIGFETESPHRPDSNRTDQRTETPKFINKTRGPGEAGAAEGNENEHILPRVIFD